MSEPDQSPGRGRNWIEQKDNQVKGLEDQVRQQQDDLARLAAADSIYRCPHCGVAQGVTSGRALTVGALIISSPVHLTCVACRTLYEWHPELSESE